MIRPGTGACRSRSACEAEHDEDAQVYLVTTSASLAKEVVRLIQVQLKGLQR